MRKLFSLGAAALVLLLGSALVGCGENPPQQPHAGPPPPVVTVAHAVKRRIVDRDEYVGRFTAVNTVEVRAQVSGYLESIHFTDGQLVKKGDLLFTIDRRPYRIALDQARANLEQARANLAFTENDLARGQQLVRDKTITEQAFDQRTQAKRVAEASVQANEALVSQAELNYNEFTLLRAPVDGRIGDRRVAPGNLVTGGTASNTTLLATIVSIDPIYFEFTFDEASFQRYKRFAAAGEAGGSAMATPVRLKLIDEQSFDHEGKINFIDNTLSASSGTIRGRAVFANPDGAFTPGMFGHIEVPGSAPYEAELVPDVAILSEQARKYVLVVNAENIARQKYVTLGQISEGMRVIKDGITPDDRVIINGLTIVRPGAKVEPREQGASPPAASGPSAAKDG